MTAPIRQRFAHSRAGAAVPGDNAAGCTAQLALGTHVILVRCESMQRRAAGPRTRPSGRGGGGGGEPAR